MKTMTILVVNSSNRTKNVWGTSKLVVGFKSRDGLKET